MNPPQFQRIGPPNVRLHSILELNSSYLNIMNKQKPSRAASVGSALILLLLAVGCASGAKPEAMVPADFAVTTRHPFPVVVEVTGGKETNPLWKSDISSDAFEKAVEAAIRNTGVFSGIVDHSNATYRLDVKLVKVMTPNVGFDMTVTVVTEWRLVETRTGATVFEEYITTPYTATVGDAFVAITRVRLANEGAARDNIKEGIRRISDMSFTPPSGS